MGKVVAIVGSMRDKYERVPIDGKVAEEGISMEESRELDGNYWDIIS